MIICPLSFMACTHQNSFNHLYFLKKKKEANNFSFLLHHLIPFYSSLFVSFFFEGGSSIIKEVIHNKQIVNEVWCHLPKVTLICTRRKKNLPGDNKKKNISNDCNLLVIYFSYKSNSCYIFPFTVE